MDLNKCILRILYACNVHAIHLIEYRMKNKRPLIITLKKFNFIIAHISLITKRTYLQFPKKKNNKKDKKESFRSIKYACSVYVLYNHAAWQAKGTS